MPNPFQAVQVTDRVHWVGAVDWNIRDFHGYATSRGTTYNAFLVMGEKVTLIDTVKAGFVDEMFSRIASVVDPSHIEVVVSNHSEMDHSGSLPRVVERVEPAEVYASANGVKALDAHRLAGGRVEAVSDGQAIDLGGCSLTCYETRMCHWPDSMVSYLDAGRVLFSQDAFGMHLAGNERFAENVPPEILRIEAAKYYANILLHLSKSVARALEKLGPLREQIDIVAPDHGPIYRRGEEIDWIVGSYARWSSQQKSRKAVVVYDTMWQSTDKMARAIADGLGESGVETKVMSMHAAHRSDVATELLDAAGLVVGSPTLNNQVFPTLADVMTYLKGLKPLRLCGASFGSFGWSGEAARVLNGWLEEMDVDVVAEPLTLKYVPSDEDLARCREHGRKIGEAIAERT
jgi:flavorubredoxin